MAITLKIGEVELHHAVHVTTEAEALRARATAARRLSADRAAAERRLAKVTPIDAAARPLQRDPIVWLEANGHLRPEHRQAGQEILQVYSAISAGIRGRAVAAYGERIPGGPRIDDWAPSLRASYTRRYAPWTDWAGTQPIRRGVWAATCRETLHDLTLLVAVDGWAPEVVARHYRMDGRTVLARLAEALHWYADHAGWIRDARGERAA